MSHLLIYTLGQHDYQVVVPGTDHPWESYKLDWTSFTEEAHQRLTALPLNTAKTTAKEMKEPRPWETFFQNGEASQEKRSWFKIFSRTLESFMHHPEEDILLDVLLINNNRQWPKAFLSETQGTQKKVPQFIEQECFGLIPLLAHHWKAFQGSFPQLRHLWGVDLGSAPLFAAQQGIPVEELEAFWKGSSQNPWDGLDLKNRDIVFPMCDQLFRQHLDDPEIVRPLAGTTPTLKAELANVTHCHLTDSTGIPLVGAVLKAVVPLHLESTCEPPAQFHLLHQGQAQVYIPFDQFLQHRAQLQTFYQFQNFAGAAAYLKALPPELAKLPFFKTHRQFCAQMALWLNRVGGEFSVESPDNPLIQKVQEQARTLYQSPVVWMMLRITDRVVQQDWPSVLFNWGIFVEQFQLKALRDAIEERWPRAIDNQGKLKKEWIQQDLLQTWQPEETSMQIKKEELVNWLANRQSKKLPLNIDLWEKLYPPLSAQTSGSEFHQLELVHHKVVGDYSLRNKRNRYTHNGVLDKETLDQLKKKFGQPEKESFLKPFQGYLTDWAAIRQDLPLLQKVPYLPAMWTETAMHHIEDYTLQQFAQEYR